MHHTLFTQALSGLVRINPALFYSDAIAHPFLAATGLLLGSAWEREQAIDTEGALRIDLDAAEPDLRAAESGLLRACLKTRIAQSRRGKIGGRVVFLPAVLVEKRSREMILTKYGRARRGCKIALRERERHSEILSVRTAVRGDEQANP